jgi:hypothetical protein
MLSAQRATLIGTRPQSDASTEVTIVHVQVLQLRAAENLRYRCPKSSFPELGINLFKRK